MWRELDLAVTEEELQANVEALARLLGWRTLHIRPARTKHGWVTPVSGDGEGFPDLLALRDERQVVAELKTETGRLSRKQRAWLEAFRNVGAEVYVWRPRHWRSGEIEAVLRGEHDGRARL